MGRKCLKCEYEREKFDTAPEYECPKCGAIYAKVEATMGAGYSAEGNLSDEDKISAIKERALFSAESKLISNINKGVKYKVVIYQEGMVGSLLFGGSKVNPVKFTGFLNSNASDGWRVVTMEKDIRRMLLFWMREAYIVIMEKEQ